MHQILVTRRGRGVRRGVACWLAVVFAFGNAAMADSAFPFDQELMLVAPPMKGSKRVPLLDVHESGAAEINLWCNSVRAQAVIARDTITIITGEKTDRTCEPERMRGDDDILSALEQVTNWRLEGDTLVLSGARTIRFRVETN
jgi:heat shock protein HslJ